MANKLWRAILPATTRRWLGERVGRVKRSLRALQSDPISVSLRRKTPVSIHWGWDRGKPVDRYYIMRFLEEQAGDVQGHVLEFENNSMTRQFGGSKVTKVDVIHLTRDNPRATFVADLSRGENLPSDTFDCIICTQVLLFIYDIHTAVRTLYRILKPGGIILVTVAGIAHKISRADMEAGGDYWRFTTLSLRRLFEEVFPVENIKVKAYGNVTAAIAFLHGFAAEELMKEDLEYYDQDYPVSIALRAVKPQAVEGATPFHKTLIKS